MIELNKALFSIAEAETLTGISATDLEPVLPNKAIGAGKYLPADALWSWYYDLLYGEEDGSMANAHISVLADGRFMVQQRLGVGENGKRKIRSKGFRTETEAISQREAWNSEYNLTVPASVAGVAVVEPKPTLTVGRPHGGMPFVDYLNWFYGREDVLTCGDRTLECYWETCRTIRAKLQEFKQGGITLQDVDDNVAMRVLNSLAKEYRQSKLDKVGIVLRKTLNYAYLKRFIDESVDISPLIKTPKSALESTAVIPYSDEEVGKLLTLAKPDPDMYTAVIILLNTGVRKEELVCLKKSDITWGNKPYISVTEVSTRKIEGQDIDSRGTSKSVISSKTKTECGKRDIPINNKLAETLTAWFELNSSKPKISGSDYILCNQKTGKPIATSSFDSRWGRFTKKHGGLEGYSLHRFRHTFCSNMARLDCPPARLQRLMGHNSEEMVKRYTTIDSRETAEKSWDIVNCL